jgi:hypothetical protein
MKAWRSLAGARRGAQQEGATYLNHRASQAVHAHSLGRSSYPPGALAAAQPYILQRHRLAYCLNRMRHTCLMKGHSTGWYENL